MKQVQSFDARTVWFHGQLRTLGHNAILDMLIKKADRADARWARIEGFFSRLNFLRRSPRLTEALPNNQLGGDLETKNA